MKSHNLPHSEVHHLADSNLAENRSTGGRGMHAVNARPPPAVPYRPYPSLSDDGQPWFPRRRRARRPADEIESLIAASPANETDHSLFFSVRAVALLAIVIILVALAASGD
jgi:hypothetical protein